MNVLERVGIILRQTYAEKCAKEDIGSFVERNLFRLSEKEPTE